MKHKILIVDDEQSVRIFLKDLFSEEGFEVCEAQDGKETLEMARSEEPNMIVLDLKLPDANGLDLIPQLKKENPLLEIIIISALGTVENAVKAIKLGAYDFITKPFEIEEILIVVKRALEYVSVSKENIALKQLQKNKIYFEEFIGESQEIVEIKALVLKLAHADVPILITGETGTGKNVVARQIHFALSDPEAPLVYINCPSIPDSLFESEFFGYEKGAFTGATTLKKGRIEEARNGTLILDEISEIPMTIQAKLLDFLQEKNFYRVGSNRQISLKTRVIALSNRDLQEEIEQGRFRKDLFYRLNLIHIHIPPFRARKDDIVLFIEYYLNLFRKRYAKNITRISDSCKQLLCQHSWPGNVRELKNVLERAFIVCENTMIDEGDVIFESSHHQSEKKDLKSLLNEYEKNLLIQALAKNNGNRTKTAEALDISLRNLQYKLSKYNIRE